MCGIVGYYGEKDAAEIVYDGLKDLEYRGYDSAGIAAVKDSSVKVEKGTGTIDEVTDAGFEGNLSIGHTRWATHGGVTKENAHPHVSHDGKVAVVHNGIIENYEELKKEIGEDKFKSETDTEVIPHLLESEYEKTGSVREACRNVEEELEGMYAVVAVFDNGEMAAIKNGNSLAVGIGDDETFISSDVTPFLGHTEKAIYLKDGDIMTVNGEMEIYNNGVEVDREVKELDWDKEEASKEGYDHYMEKEIKEEPSAVRKAVIQDREDMEEAVEMLDNARKIYTTGCGTAGICASLGAKYLRDAGYEVDTQKSHELEYRKDEIQEDDVVIAVSQSGETADLLSVIRDVEADVIANLNVADSTLAREAEKPLYINAGPEIAVASTKAFVAQLALFKLLSYTAKGEFEEGKGSLLETADKIEDVFRENEEEIEEISDYLRDREHAYFVGRNKGVEMAEEASLKLKEISYIHSEAFQGGEFKHGTIALVEEGTPVVGFLKEENFKDIESNLREAKARGADVIGVGKEDLMENDLVDHPLTVPDDPNSEILEIAPMQWIAYRTAVKVDHVENPDKPRNLAKSITVK